jgi:4-amino-4-deoxy-L-arabinose transferase-like glycosyltransferase
LAALDRDASQRRPDTADLPAPPRLDGFAASSAFPALIVVGLTALGIALRLAVAPQSLFADELSTYWIVSHKDFAGVISTVHGDSEITPPLYFVLSWLTTRIEMTPELLRAPSLIAGVAAIPLTYLLGLKTVGQAAGLVAAAIAAFAPFMVFFSAQARGYELMLVLVLCSTLAMLAAIDSGRALWWIVYGASSCAATYTHYPAVIALGAQLAWLLWAHPEARKPALIANVGAVLAFLPWYSGLINDFNSPTTELLSNLTPFTAQVVSSNLEHWAIGYPFGFPNTELRDLPGTRAIVMLLLAAATAAGSLGVAWFRRPGSFLRFRPDPHLVLVIVLAASSAVGLVLMSALGTNLFAVRSLAASWPAFAVSLAALLVRAGRWLWFVATALAVVSFAIGGAMLLESGFKRPDYEAAAALIDRNASPGDVVIDAAAYTPAPITGTDAALERPHRVFHVGGLRIRYDPYATAPRPATAAVVDRAIAAAHGHRLFVVSFAGESALLRAPGDQVVSALTAGHRQIMRATYPGVIGVTVTVFTARGGPPRE